MTESPTRETFERCESREFRLEPGPDGAGALALELVECATLPSGRAPEGREPFSLLFRGPAQPVLPQRIYRLENDDLGELEIFLVPVGSDPEATTYEAVFA